MSTIRDLITGSLRLINVVSEPEFPTAYQTQTGLEALNELIDQFNSDQITIFAQSIHELPMTGGKGTFTIGPGGDIDVASRPFEIENAFLRLNSGSATPADVPMAILSASEWMNVRSKSVQSPYPRYVYLNGDWPVATAYLWPVPNSGDGTTGLLS